MDELEALRSQWWAEVAALMNDRADMWEGDNRPGLMFECRNLANAFRTYAEGVGVPSMDTLRRKLREAEEKLAEVWDEGHRHPQRRGPDDCQCFAHSWGECACGEYGNGELVSLADNPYRAKD